VTFPTKEELLRIKERSRLQLENMVRVLDLFNASVEASMNPPEHKEDANASREELG